MVPMLCLQSRTDSFLSLRCCFTGGFHLTWCGDSPRDISPCFNVWFSRFFLGFLLATDVLYTKEKGKFRAIVFHYHRPDWMLTDISDLYILSYASCEIWGHMMICDADILCWKHLTHFGKSLLRDLKLIGRSPVPTYKHAQPEWFRQNNWNENFWISSIATVRISIFDNLKETSKMLAAFFSLRRSSLWYKYKIYFKDC